MITTKYNAIIGSLFFLFLFTSTLNFTSNNEPIHQEAKKIHFKSDTIIQSFPCTGWIHFYEDGKLKQFELARDYVISGIIFPKGSIIFLDKNSKLYQVYLSKDTKIHSYPCPGGKMKVATGFYPSGKLRFFFPRKDMLINGYPVKGGSLYGVWFFESGKLKKFTLTKDYFIDGKQYHAGDLVVRKEN